MKRTTNALLSIAVAAACAPIAQQAQAYNLGSLVYEPLETPCRILDTRVAGAGGPLVAGSPRSFLAYGTAADLAGQGAQTDCLHPKNAEGLAPAAISANVAAIGNQATGTGNIAAYATGAATVPTSSAINYKPGTNISNSTIIGLCEGECATGDFDLISNLSTVPATVDVEGYFYPRNLKNEITVSPAGGDFTTIAAALAFLRDLIDNDDPNAPSLNTPWTIRVGPGNYQGPIDLIADVSIVGPSRHCDANILSASGLAVRQLASGGQASTLQDICIVASGSSPTGLLIDEGAVALKDVSLIVASTDGSRASGVEVANGGTMVAEDANIAVTGGPNSVGVTLQSGGEAKLGATAVAVRTASGAGTGLQVSDTDSYASLSDVNVSVEAVVPSGLHLYASGAVAGTDVAVSAQGVGTRGIVDGISVNTTASLSLQGLDVTVSADDPVGGSALTANTTGRVEVNGGYLRLLANGASIGRDVTAIQIGNSAAQPAVFLQGLSIYAANTNGQPLRAVNAVSTQEQVIAGSVISGLVEIDVDSKVAFLNNVFTAGQGAVTDRNSSYRNCRGNYSSAPGTPNKASNLSPAAAEYTPDANDPQNKGNYFGEVGC